MTPQPFTEEDIELVAAATEQHHIEHGRTDAMGNNPCVCDAWWDSAETEGWDQHMAAVTLGALAEAGRLQPQPEPLTVAIDVGTLKALVDLVTGSLDFGSGFLVDEDVDTLRTAAIVLGLDPMDVTPYDYAKRYPHEFEVNDNDYAAGVCKTCGKPKGHEAHPEPVGADLLENHHG